MYVYTLYLYICIYIYIYIRKMHTHVPRQTDKKNLYTLKTNSQYTHTELQPGYHHRDSRHRATNLPAHRHPHLTYTHGPTTGRESHSRRRATSLPGHHHPRYLYVHLCYIYVSSLRSHLTSLPCHQRTRQFDHLQKLFLSLSPCIPCLRRSEIAMLQPLGGVMASV